MATGLAHKTAKRLLAMAEFSNQFPISFGLFDRIKVLALDILNESDFQRFRIVEIANNGWNAMELGPLSGPPASLAGNDLVAPALRPHNDGLNNATLRNALRKFSQRVHIEVTSGLFGMGCDKRNIDVLNRLAGGRRSNIYGFFPRTSPNRALSPRPRPGARRRGLVDFSAVFSTSFMRQFPVRAIGRSVRGPTAYRLPIRSNDGHK